MKPSLREITRQFMFHLYKPVISTLECMHTLTSLQVSFLPNRKCVFEVLDP